RASRDLTSPDTKPSEGGEHMTQVEAKCKTKFFSPAGFAHFKPAACRRGDSAKASGTPFCRRRERIGACPGSVPVDVYATMARRETVMLVSRRSFTLAILALMLAGGVAAALWYASPVRRQGGSLTGAEIAALVSGNTVKGPKFSEYYAPDGSI